MPKAHKVKVCAKCGRAEGKHWARHWRQHHPGSNAIELIPGEVPIDPYDEGWLYLIQPLSLRERYTSTA